MAGLEAAGEVHESLARSQVAASMAERTGAESMAERGDAGKAMTGGRTDPQRGRGSREPATDVAAPAIRSKTAPRRPDC